MISGVKVLFCYDGSLTVPFTFATILCLASFCFVRSTEYHEQSYTIPSSPIISFHVLSNITSSPALSYIICSCTILFHLLWYSFVKLNPHLNPFYDPLSLLMPSPFFYAFFAKQQINRRVLIVIINLQRKEFSTINTLTRFIEPSSWPLSSVTCRKSIAFLSASTTSLMKNFLTSFGIGDNIESPLPGTEVYVGEKRLIY